MRHSCCTPRIRRGFTLVELLVVIAIIGTLVALLLPAVQSARESARNNTCKNSLKNLSLALINYDTNQGKLPGYINDIEDVRSDKITSGGLTQYRRARQASWVVMIFPQLEQNALWDNWSNVSAPTGSAPTPRIANGNTPQIDLLVCASNEPTIPGNPWLSYVANSGRMFTDSLRGADDAEYAANGLFLDKSVNLNAIPSSANDDREDRPLQKVSISNLIDGASNTVLLSESLYSYYWTYVNDNGDPVANSQDKATMPDPKIQADDKKFFGFTWTNDRSSDCSGTETFKINGVDPSSDLAVVTDMRGINDCHTYTSSNHPGGVNMAFCDGRVEYLNDNVEPRIYGQLMTSNSRRSQFVSGGTPDRRLPPVSSSDY